MNSSTTSDHPDTDTPTVLVVEDHSETLFLLEMLLSRAGFAVATAFNVTDALKRIATDSYRVLVSDIGLPDGTGFDVVRAFRARSDAPAIALSGYGAESDLEEGAQAGFTHYLVKPRGVSELVPLLKRMFQTAN